MQARWALAAALFAVMMSGSVGCNDDEVAPSYATRWQAVDCTMKTPEGRQTDCGILTVPEDRSAPPRGPAPDSATQGWVRLHVAIVRAAEGDGSPPPVVYLNGGPGYGVLDGIGGEPNPAFRKDRDRVFFDQRGTGRSEPSLRCDEYAELTWTTLGKAAPFAKELDLLGELASRCREQLEGNGVRLSAYNTAESALDVRDLRQALAIHRWDVYGVSYGSSLAQQVLRVDRQGVRAVILDSVLPLDDLGADRVALAAERAFDKLFDGCAADESCAQKRPDLRGDFWKLVDAFNAAPHQCDVEDPASGKPRAVTIEGNDVAGGLFLAMYDTGLLPMLPNVLALIEAKVEMIFAELVGKAIRRTRTMSLGSYLSVECHDRGRNATRAEVDKVIDERPWAGSLYALFGMGACEQWGVPAAEPAFNELVTGATPTLVLAGAYDPITPPTGARRVAEALDSATYVEFPQVGHGAVGASTCAAEILAAFLADPTKSPDTSCVADERPPDFQ